MLLSLFLTSALTISTLSTDPKDNSATLTVKISNVEHREGHVKAVLFDRNNFLSEDYVACLKMPAGESNGDVQTSFFHVPPGDYAVAIYQDLNDNNWFDRNWIGYPKEPFAISNNLHPFNLLYPEFDAAKVHVDPNSSLQIDIKLLNN